MSKETCTNAILQSDRSHPAIQHCLEDLGSVYETEGRIAIINVAGGQTDNGGG